MHFTTMILFLCRAIMWLSFETVMECDRQAGIDSVMDLTPIRPMIIITISVVAVCMIVVLAVDCKCKK